MRPKLFDVHTHIQFAAYAADADAVARRALDAGTWIVNVGTKRETSEQAIAFAHRYPEGVYATVGLHPTHTAKSYHDEKESDVAPEGEEFDYARYGKMAEDEKVVAIGECGLDYFRLTEETKALQQKVFKEHIKLASEIGKPLMIHCRNAFPDLISILQTTDHKLPAIPGIIHFMTGTKEDARELLALGFSFSFGGVLTFARDYDEVVRSIPLERILLETDAPYVAPAPYRGKRNEPAYVMESAKKIAEIKDVPFEDVARVTTENAVRIFGIDA